MRSGFINSYRGSAKIPDYDSRNRFGGAIFCMNTDMQRRQSVRITVLVAMSFCLSAPIHSQDKSGAGLAQPEISAPKRIIDQSISETVYKNGAGRFTLTVPAGWRSNDDIVEPKFGIGGLSSPDNEAQIEIQQIPTEDSPTAFAKKVDAKGDSLFRGYRRLGESKLNVAGRSCEVLTFAWVQERKTAGEPIVLRLVSRFVLMPNGYSIFVFNLVTPEALVEKELPTFEEIIESFHSTAPANLFEKPK